MSNFNRDELKDWFRRTHPSMDQSSGGGLITESYGDANDPYNPDANADLVKRDMDIAHGGGMTSKNTSIDDISNNFNDVLYEELTILLSSGLATKEIATLIGRALDDATLSVKGKEAQHKVEITELSLGYRR